MKKPRLMNVKLREIFGPHPELSELMRPLAGSRHAWCVGSFSEPSVEALTALHPIVLQEAEQHGYHVIGGFRTYQLATVHCEPDRPLRAMIYSGFSSNQIRQLAAIDILGSPLLLGLGSRPQKQVERLCQSLHSFDLKVIHPDLTSLRGIKRLLRGGEHA